MRCALFTYFRFKRMKPGIFCKQTIEKITRRVFCFKKKQGKKSIFHRNRQQSIMCKEQCKTCCAELGLTDMYVCMYLFAPSSESLDYRARQSDRKRRLWAWFWACNGIPRAVWSHFIPGGRIAVVPCNRMPPLSGPIKPFGFHGEDGDSQLEDIW